MASYKVPQDVEADDKLLGPFSFRQFIYLMIVAGAIALGWVLWNIFPPLVIIVVPFVVFFGALALPLRKDQPMETYLAAILSFYLKPRIRLWEPDGLETLVKIAASKEVEPLRTKNVSEGEAVQRLQYLSSIADTKGWAVRGVYSPINNNSGTSMNEEFFNEAQQADDLLDESNVISQNLNQMISNSDAQRHSQLLERMKNPVTSETSLNSAMPNLNPQNQAALQPAPTLNQQQPPVLPPTANFNQVTQNNSLTNDFTNAAPPIFNPYPSSMNQTVIQPLSQATAPPEQTPVQADLVAAPENPPITPIDSPSNDISKNEPSPDIISLANNSDLSVETIARQANRLKEKEAGQDEVYISLR